MGGGGGKWGYWGDCDMAGQVDFQAAWWLKYQFLIFFNKMTFIKKLE